MAGSVGFGLAVARQDLGRRSIQLFRVFDSQCCVHPGCKCELDRVDAVVRGVVVPRACDRWICDAIADLRR